MSRTIKQLTDVGHKVFVRHFRWGTIKSQLGVPAPYRILVPTTLGCMFDFYNLGGGTAITIHPLNTDQEFVAQTQCSHKDNFCYKEGVKQALNKLPEDLWLKLTGSNLSDKA